MKILIINCGSSSLKYQLIDMEKETVLAKGLCERIGIAGSNLTHKAAGKEEYVLESEMSDHKVAIQLVLDALVDSTYGVIGNISEISAIGHRVVHGSKYYSSSVIINDEVKKKIKDCYDLAPLHNPANLIGIEACEAAMPDKVQVAVFDTAFHQTMPEKAYIYAIPYSYFENYDIRRYGFHGTSHSFVSERATKFAGLDKNNSKVIVCHLGNGGSISAVVNGKCVDTSMGLTPLEGLIMGTRSGDLDPAIIQYIARKEGKNIDEIIDILNKKSGVLGVSGVSSDFRDVQKAQREGNKRADIAVKAFVYRVAKYIGAYVAAMNGVDAICFTAGVGENDSTLRAAICSYLGYLGVTIEEEKNLIRGEEVVISTADSKVIVMAIPTNEELAIARETKALL